MYDPFDAIVGSTGSQDNAFTFTGEQTDPSTGLEYLRAATSTRRRDGL